MKATDLMLGDWVLCDGKPYQVAEISAGLLCIDAERELFATPEDLEPIPLTLEILEKNEFDCSDKEIAWLYFEDGNYRGHFSLRAMYNKISGEQEGWSFYAFNVVTILDYVHQLQHALRLCGIEKEIVL